MPPENTQDKRWLEALEALLRSRETIASLARRIGRPRETVSRCLNQGKHPEVREEIKKALFL
jgi:transposase-like protein